MPAPDALALLLSRQSVGIRHLGEPGPDDAALRQLAAAALKAPDHGGLVPFRFAVVRGGQRQRLGELFMQVARDAGKDAQTVAIEGERAMRAPVTLAVIARIDLGHPAVPAHEQWACIGGAITNVLNAAHGLGYAGKMLSGRKARHPALQQAFCGPGETLLGWIALGTAADSPSRGHAKPVPEAVMRDWQAPG